MKTYIVGGWVRDHLLAQAGRPSEQSGDRDWVVVGSTPDELTKLGYEPVGKDFPVFLHPQTHEEYALARTERKTAPGYRGFVVHAAPDVTLEDDLQRRDLTVNAMAMDEAGTLIDPHGGQRDLVQRTLRHVGPAFVEDPVRILRMARFAARFPDFTVAPDTLALARRMVASGEVDALVAERVWQEISRGLMERRPSRMLEVLRDTGAWLRLYPEVPIESATLDALDRAARARQPLAVRFSILASGARSSAELQSWLGWMRADSDSLQLARLLWENRDALGKAEDAQEMTRLIVRADAIRRPERFGQLIDAVQILDNIDGARWKAAAAAVASVDAGKIAREVGPDPAAINRALGEARVAAVAKEAKGN